MREQRSLRDSTRALFQGVRRFSRSLRSLYGDLRRGQAQPKCPHCGGVRCLGLCGLLGERAQSGGKHDA
ncbi:MAG: hypothetical protein LBR82_03760 [Desulfovibrio sp.]|nr:hypothetical protein [Desulfovibrio sp.]